MEVIRYLGGVLYGLFVIALALVILSLYAGFWWLVVETVRGWVL